MSEASIKSPSQGTLSTIDVIPREIRQTMSRAFAHEHKIECVCITGPHFADLMATCRRLVMHHVDVYVVAGDCLRKMEQDDAYKSLLYASMKTYGAFKRESPISISDYLNDFPAILSGSSLAAAWKTAV